MSKSDDIIRRQDAIKAIDKRIIQLSEKPEFRRKHADIDLYGAKELIREIPSAEPKTPGHFEQLQDAYERGQAAAMRDASCRAYNEITKYLERQNVPRAKERADYIMPIIESMMADEVMGGEE